MCRTAPPSHVLVVDDDPASTGTLCRELDGCGFQAWPVAAAEGPVMADLLARLPIALVVLDLMRPSVEGLQLLRSLRSASRIPIILLTDPGATSDRVVGLELGADDCMSRPCESRELAVRIQCVLRRAGQPSRWPAAAAAAEARPEVVAFDGWQLHRAERELTSPRGQRVPLSNAEFLLLDTFLRAPRRVVSRERLAEQSRGQALPDAGRSVDLLVSRLRHKLAAAQPTSGDALGLIRTVRGAGYLFDARSVQGVAALR